MEYREYQTAQEFLNCVELQLQNDPAANTLMLGIAKRLVTEPLAYGTAPFFATVTDSGRVEAAVLRTPPHPLILCANHEGAIDLLIDKVQAMDIPAVVGKKESVEYFIQQGIENYAWQTSQRMALRCFELRHVVAPERVEGSLEIAAIDALDLLTTWTEHFIIEANVPEKIADVQGYVRKAIESGTIYNWVLRDGEIAAMAWRTRPMERSISIGYVYTPLEFRGKGIASNLVADLSSLLLAAGYEYCSLFTDLANPTSNSIYQKIGYRPVIDFAQYDITRVQ